MTDPFPSFSAIRAAILAAPVPASGFPLDALRDPEALTALRAAAHLQPFLSDMRAEADRAQSTALEPLTFRLFHLFEATGDREAYERLYFDRHRRLLGLALTSVIDETDNYLSALEDLIWAVCNEYTWALPAHLPVGVAVAAAHRVPPEQVVDLFAAHTAHALAEVASLLGERLDPWLHYRIRTEIERRIFQPAFYDPVHFWWESAPMNWAAVCAGCVGMAALLLETDREQLAGMIDRVLRTMACFLEGFGESGGCPEGISYWVYGFGFYTYFAEMLHAFTGGQLDLLQGEHVRRIAAFPQAVSLGGDCFVNYSDAPERALIHPGLGSRLRVRLQQPMPGLQPPDFHGDPIYRWGNATRDLLWTEVGTLDRQVPDGQSYLNDIGWVIDRRRVGKRVVAFSAKGGHNDEPHNHNDLGHFILHLGGESLLADLGAGVYTRQYFSGGRYESLHTGAQGHSVPVLNGQLQQAGPTQAASVVHYEARSEGLTFALDLTRAYPPDAHLESVVRTFDWSFDPAQDAAILRLEDAFGFSALPAAIEECFISLVRPRVEARTVRWEGTAGRVTLTFDPARFAAEVEPLETHTHDHEPLPVYRLRLTARQTHQLTQTDTFVFDCRLFASP